MKNIFKKYVEYLKDNPEGYWFRAKLYGWGWTPARWQGWAILSGFIALIILNTVRFESNRRVTNPSSENEAALYFVGETFLLAALLIFICYKTGEKPRWQWGPPRKN